MRTKLVPMALPDRRFWLALSLIFAVVCCAAALPVLAADHGGGAAMLGMVIGVGAVVLMMSIGQGAQYAIKQTISAMGSNLFVLISGSRSVGGVRSGSGGNYTLTSGDAEAIAELPGVQAAAPIHSGNAQIVYGPNNWNTSIIGTTPSYLEARSWPVISGSAFAGSDVRSATRVALIGKTAADFPALTWSNFIFGNLIPVTVGNVIAGSVLVGAVYWFVYLRKQKAL